MGGLTGAIWVGNGIGHGEDLIGIDWEGALGSTRDGLAGTVLHGCGNEANNGWAIMMGEDTRTKMVAGEDRRP